MTSMINISDRELLELAAKAAGITIIRWGQTAGAFIENGSAWSPLTDDGDAFRLVMALDMVVHCNRDALTVIVQTWFPKLCKAVRSNNCDADVRRAIVEVAAMKGRLTP